MMAGAPRIPTALARRPAVLAPRVATGLPFLGSEEMLLAHVDGLANARRGQRAMIVHLSRLAHSHRRDKHLQIVASMLHELTEQYAGRVFLLGGGDLVLVCKGITRKAFDETTEVLRYLFNDDPLAREGEQADLCAFFDLEIGYGRFLHALEEIREAAGAGRPAGSGLRAGQGGDRHGAGVDPARAADLLKAASRVDLAQMLRRQTVWKMPPGGTPEPVFEELFVSIERLRKAIGSSFDLARERELFHYLTRWLDKYVLATVLRHQAHLLRPLSVNLNIHTMLSPDLADFAAQRPNGWEGRVILEVQLVDVWPVLPALLAAAEAAKRRGFGLCLDGVSHQALPLLNLRRLPVDHVKVVWDDALLHLDETALRTFCAAVTECGAERVILTRCGRSQAIQFGQATGITLFQGWQVDQANQLA